MFLDGSEVSPPSEDKITQCSCLSGTDLLLQGMLPVDPSDVRFWFLCGLFVLFAVLVMACGTGTGGRRSPQPAASHSSQTGASAAMERSVALCSDPTTKLIQSRVIGEWRLDVLLAQDGRREEGDRKWG